MNRRARGPLDALIEAMPHGRVCELARCVPCSRRQILRWQKGAYISDINVLRLNAVAIAYGLHPMFSNLGVITS